MARSRNPYVNGLADGRAGLHDAAAGYKNAGARRNYTDGYVTGTTERRRVFHALKVWCAGGELIR